MFEKASRLKLRFETKRGFISVEDLWDLPLINNNGFSLDETAKAVSRKLKESEEESFVVKSTKANDVLKLQLEIIKHVIAVKLDEVARASEAKSKHEFKQKLMEIVAEKEVEGLRSKSKEEIEKLIAELE